MLMGCSRRVLVDFQRLIAEEDLRAELARLDVPVTLIHGARDASAPLELTARRIAEIVPAAELIVYEDAAHGLMLTHARRVVEDLLAAS